MRQLNVGVIGLGYFGSRHARIHAYHPAVDLKAVCDLNPDTAVSVASITGADAMTDPMALLAREDIEAVSLCLPDRQHEAVAVAAARAGKAILLEKPMAHTTVAARQIAQTVETHGTRLMVGHILRFDPRYVQLHAAAAPERLGKVIHVRAKRNGIRDTARRLGSSSSILFYMGVHDVDAMQWIARSRISRVYARKREVLGTGNEDVLYAVVEFENGALGSLDYSWAWPNGMMNGYRAAFEIVGTQSAAALDVTDQGFHTVDERGTAGGDTHLWPEINGRIVGDLADEIDHFVMATLTGAPYIQPWQEALDAIPVLDALAESAQSGHPVNVERGS